MKSERVKESEGSETQTRGRQNVRKLATLFPCVPILKLGFGLRYFDCERMRGRSYASHKLLDALNKEFLMF